MIDFKSIRYTLGGLECYYCGQRKSGNQVLHRFAVVNGSMEVFQYYDDQGRRLEYVGPGMWVGVSSEHHDIIKPWRKVEVTRWLTYHRNADGIFVRMHNQNPEGKELTWYAGKTVKVTEVFEVPE